MVIRWSGALVAGALLACGSAHAMQVPGDELPSSQRVRAEYLTSTFTDIKGVVADWARQVGEGDAVRAARLFTQDGLFSPSEGWYAQGRATVADSLATRLPNLRGYHTSFVDFTASGNLAYYLGRLQYRLEHPTDPAEVHGTFVMVLYLDGRTWRIRSYVERVGG